MTETGLFTDLKGGASTGLFDDLKKRKGTGLFDDLKQPEVDLEAIGVAAAPAKELFPGTGITQETQADFGAFLKDIPVALTNGIIKAGEGVVNAVVDIQNFMEGKDLQEQLPENLRSPEIPTVEFPTVGDTQTAGGKFLQEATRFTAGFIPATKAMQGLSAAGKGLSAGFLADSIVMDPQEARLSNLIEEFPRLKNPVTEFLQSDEEDSRIVGRLKNGIEGLGIGLGFETFLKGLRALKATRQLRAETIAAEDAARPQTFKENLQVEPVAQEQAAGAAPRGVDDLLTPVDPLPTQRRGGREVPVAGNLNLDRQAISQEAKSAEVRVAESQGGFREARGQVPNRELELLAEETGLDITRLQGKGFTSAAILQKRNQLADSADNLIGLAKSARGGGDEALLSFQEGLAKHVALQEEVAGITSEIGRALNQFKIEAKTQKVREKLIRDIIEGQGGRETIEAKAKLLSDLEDPAQFGKAAQELFKAKTKDKIVEAWINGLLSGPQTHITNALSNSLVALYSVPEKFVAAGAGALSRSQDRVLFREAAAKASGMFRGMQKATEAAYKQFKFEESPELFSRVSKIEGPRQAIPGRLGKFARIPSRALESADVWFKMINYAGEQEALAVRRGVKKGLSGQALADDVAATLRNPPEDLQAQAWKSAETNTFTLSLREQEGLLAGAGRLIQKGAQDHLALKAIFPFVRTPVNILKFSLERSPLGFAMADMRKAIKAGGVQRNEALAKIALGTSVIGTSYKLAGDGLITGGGPTNPAEKRVLRQTGWQPYSIKIGDTYYSYARLEPLGTMLGVAADSQRIINDVVLNDKEKEKLATAVLTAVAQNATNKTFLRGMTEMVKAIDPGNPTSDPGRFLEQLVASAATPTALSQAAKATDPTLRDVRGIIDRINSRVPGLSDKVQPLLNLWGEEIKRDGGFANNMFSPVYISKIKDDPVSNELVRLKVAPMMPQRVIGGVELTPAQYTRYAKLAGQQAKQQLDGMLSDRSWRNTPDVIKSDIITTVINDARSSARDQMLFDNPDLLRQVQDKELEGLQ